MLAVVLCGASLRAQDGSETPMPSAAPTVAPTPVEAAATPVAATTTTPLAEAPPTAQSFTPAPTLVPPAASPRVLYPSTAGAALAKAGQGNGTAATANLTVTFLVLAGLCAGGYYLLKRQPGFVAGLKSGPRKLNVSESRSLGNRQFLVVVEYENERMLLGVTPGKIDYLCPLRGPVGDAAVFPAPGGANP